MITVSLCMIVKNEEETLARCLDCIHDIVDEIIIVDTGSTDRTKEIAAHYTSHIYDFKWVDNFATARNFSFSKATQEYIMWLDADDIILPTDREKLRLLKSTLEPNIDTVIMKYNLLSRENDDLACTFFRERLVKRSKNFKWYDPVHEYILFTGTFTRSDIAITHKKMHPPTGRNLEIFEKYLAAGNTLTERNWFYYARELFHAGKIDKAATYYEKFLETKGGLISNYLDACVELSQYYTLKKDDTKSLQTLLRYFERESPRAEICCKIGTYYKDRENYDAAISWFKMAPHTPKPLESLGAMMLQYWDYIPYMELCACYYHIGDLDHAIQYNEKAAQIKPDDAKILHNRVFLGTIKEKLIEKHNLEKNNKKTS